MLRNITNITIIQQPSTDFPQRTRTMIFNFNHSFECKDVWRDLTNDGKVVVPKNIYIRDGNGQLVSISGTNQNIGGFTVNQNTGNPIPPLLLRGDHVTIEAGYRYFLAGKEVTQTTVIFTGYISKVTSKKPLEFLVEDNMWKLKQIQVPVHTFTASDTLENILTFLLQGSGFTVNALTSTNFGAFRVGNETVAEVLARLRKDYHFESYFKGNELRCGAMVYIESEAILNTFTFQKDIISDQLEYRRKDDIVLSAVVSNTISEDTGATTKDGQAKTKKIRLEALVTLQMGSDIPNVVIKTKGVEYPPNTGGERRTLFYPGAFTIADLVALATVELKKYYYTGFKGTFTTFAIPYVKMGDNVTLLNTILPEQNGTYKVKGVKYMGGVDGIKQEIELDYKILL